MGSGFIGSTIVKILIDIEVDVTVTVVSRESINPAWTDRTSHFTGDRGDMSISATSYDSIVDLIGYQKRHLEVSLANKYKS